MKTDNALGQKTGAESVGTSAWLGEPEAAISMRDGVLVCRGQMHRHREMPMMRHEPTTPEQAFVIAGGGKWWKCSLCTCARIEYGAVLLSQLEKMRTQGRASSPSH